MTTALATTVLAVDRSKLAQARAAAEQIATKLASLPCETAEQEQAFTDFRNRAHTVIQDLDGERKEQVRPLVDGKREIDELYKGAVEPWEQVKKLCNSKIEAAALARHKAQEEARRAVIALAQSAPIENVEVALAQAIAAAPEPVKSVGGSVTFEWVVADTDVLEMAKHPMGQQYLIADTKSLARVCAAAKNQEHPPVVPGVTFQRRAKAGVK